MFNNDLRFFPIFSFGIFWGGYWTIFETVHLPPFSPNRSLTVGVLAGNKGS